MPSCLNSYSPLMLFSSPLRTEILIPISILQLRESRGNHVREESHWWNETRFTWGIVSPFYSSWFSQWEGFSLLLLKRVNHCHKKEIGARVRSLPLMAWEERVESWHQKVSLYPLSCERDSDMTSLLCYVFSPGHEMGISYNRLYIRSLLISQDLQRPLEEIFAF
jgi:hypothetical protein